MKTSFTKAKEKSAFASGASIASSIDLNSKTPSARGLLATYFITPGFGVLSAYTVTGTFFDVSSSVITSLSLFR